MEGKKDNSEWKRAAGARPSYDASAAVQYALNWTSGANYGDNPNQLNRKYPFYNNNCANFVSQSLHESGVNYAKNYVINYKDDDTWAFYGFDRASYTWGGAANNYQYMRNHSGLFRDETQSLYYPDGGSLLYGDWDADGSINHVAIVTSSPRIGFQDDGTMLFMPHITQKSTCRHDVPLSAYLPISYKQHSKINWYALSPLWVPLPWNSI